MTDRPTDTSNEPFDPRIEAALEWLVQLHSGEATAADRAAYDTWRRATPEQEAAAVEAEVLWNNLGSVAKPKRRRTPRLKRSLTATALLLAFLGAAAGAMSGAPRAWFADHRTLTGERRTLSLSDGSRLELNTGTSVDVDFTAERRRLMLHAGEIHVVVSADTSRPFAVAAAGGTVRALGTAFDIRRDGDAVRVIVTDHAVQVAYPETANTATVEVKAGESISYDATHGLSAPVSADVRALTAWRRGWLVFDNRPFGEVVDEMARYRNGLVLVTDRALRNLPVTGVFETGDADALLDAVAVALPVRIRRLPWLVVIEPDPSRRTQFSR